MTAHPTYYHLQLLVIIVCSCFIVISNSAATVVAKEIDFEKLLENADGPIDETDVCEELANAGNCVNSEEMPQYCGESCRKWADRNNFGGPKSVNLDLDDGDDTFYDLQAKLFNSKKKISFDRFEGYLTVICNIGKICDDSRDIEQTVVAMQSLFKIMPYSLNILLFPFKIPSIKYEDEDCSNFENILAEASKNELFKDKLFFMEEAALNGPYVHPVYEFLKRKTDQPELMETHATFYFLNGEGTKLEVLQGASFGTLRNYIISTTKDAYGL